MRAGIRAGIRAVLAGLAVAGCGAPETAHVPPPALQETPPPQIEEAAPPSELVGQGQAMAETLCAGCHAIGLTGDSPNSEAMPFRQINWHYPVEMLAEPLAEGIMVAHPKMPQWQFEPDQIDALLAYLETVQVPEEG